MDIIIIADSGSVIVVLVIIIMLKVELLITDGVWVTCDCPQYEDE